jgi:peroxiredoxin Q/BCP
MRVEKGSKIPSFTLPDQNGKTINIEDYIGKKNLVIYFYPKNDTPGCTAEACSFRDQFEDLRDAGAEIIGISSDSIQSHKQFAEKHRLPFILLSDAGKKVRKAFGVPADFLGLLPGRVTYIVDKKGIVLHVFNSQFNARQHVDEALKILKQADQSSK